MAYTRHAHSPTSSFSSSFERISVMLPGLCQRLEAYGPSAGMLRASRAELGERFRQMNSRW